ncbi:hypothetical protein AVEN_173129-1 [Araneus ventricosus]|uniref:Uncharacterized protein n=1 Tax=Araneus ventricosus TaxID=182803 RepID=A0A4Y2FMY2_ARAVE|nr:hypothetical protein AVEN_173129-1 [Araneus ventricosus]
MNVSNVVVRNKIWQEKTKARSTLLSQSVIKDYDHDQFGLYFDGRKERTLSMEDNRKKVIIEEHLSLVKEPGFEYVGHISVNYGSERKSLEIKYRFLSCVDNDIDVTKFFAIGCGGTSVNTGVKDDISNLELILNRPI